MDLTAVRRICLEYAVRHDCYRTFDAIYSKEVKSELKDVDLALFAIRRIIYDNEVYKFPVAMDILGRIYSSREKGLRHHLKVYLKLIYHMKKMLFLWSIQLENKEEMIRGLKAVMSTKILDDEEGSNQNRAQLMMWEFYRLVMPILQSHAKKTEYLSKLPDRVSVIPRKELTKLMDKFSSKIRKTFPPCYLDQMITKIKEHDAADPGTKFELALQDIIKDKHALTDEDLLELVEQSQKHDENCNEIGCKDLEEAGVEVDMNRSVQFKQASLQWDKESLVPMDDMLSVVAPSVSEDVSSIELSDLEETVKFKDSEIIRTPDLSPFLKRNGLD